MKHTTPALVIGQKSNSTSSRLPRFILVWLAVSFVALVVAGTISANDKQPDGYYIPTATFTFTPTNTPTCVPTPPPTGGGVSYDKRINAGGNTYTDTLNNLWDSDVQYAPCGSPSGWTTGAAYSVTNAISDTPDPLLYQSQRYGVSFGYRFLLPNGNYAITLGFAETYAWLPGLRRFDVSVNGAVALADVDVFAAAGGPFIAYDRIVAATVTNGMLTIDFAATTGAAMISRIYVHQILPSTPTATLTATSTPTATSTDTPTVTPTDTVTATPTDTPARLSTKTPTFTPADTSTSTPTPTPTDTATSTPPSTPTDMPTSTPTVTKTPAPSDSRYTIFLPVILGEWNRD